jgi:methyl-accepting chemotaxis protein
MLAISRLPIRIKLPLAFSFVLLINLVLGGVALDRLGAIDLSAGELRDNWLPSTGLAGKLIAAAADARIRLGCLILAESDADRQSFNAALDQSIADTVAARKAFGGDSAAVADDEAYLKDFDQNWASYLQLTAKIVAAARAGDRHAATMLYAGDGQTAYRAAMTAIGSDLDFNLEAGKQAGDRGTEVYAATRVFVLIALAVAVLASALLGWSMVRAVAAPLIGMTGAMQRLAGHDLGIDIPDRGRSDEIGAMAEAVAVFKASMIDSDRLQAEQRAAQSVKEQRVARITELNRDFDRSATASFNLFAAAATEMRERAGGMSNNADRASKQAGAVAAAADEASANVQTVAAATEELAKSIDEITQQVTTSRTIAGQAVREAELTGATVRSLSEAAQKIGQVVQLISDIASQTNLLALNATIEAARAGEAGKGFAVVASEVKGLATQTARATDDITTQVAAMQTATREAVEAIGRIDETIGRMNEISTAIAAAMEQQGTVTQDIARNVEQAAIGTASVSKNIVGVNQAADETGSAAVDVLASADRLGKQAQTMRNEVDTFLAEIRRA